MVLLDACSVLNLAASRRMEQVIQCLDADIAIAEAVAKEALFVRRGGSGEDAHETDPVLLQPLIEAGHIEVISPETDAEFASYVRFAAQLDDGEAMTCALALERGYAVATDDRKALRVMREHDPPIQSLTTSDLLRAWVARMQPSEAELIRVLTDIRERARFLPSRRDPHHGWWLGLLDAK